MKSRLVIIKCAGYIFWQLFLWRLYVLPWNYHWSELFCLGLGLELGLGLWLELGLELGLW